MGGSAIPSLELEVSSDESKRGQKGKSGGFLLRSVEYSRKSSLSPWLLVERGPGIASRHGRDGHLCGIESHYRVFVRAEAAGTGLTGRKRLARNGVGRITCALGSSNEVVAALAAVGGVAVVG